MSDASFKVLLYLPAQGAAETEATIVEWRIGPGDPFEKGQVLADIESAKAVFEFEAPCAGTVIRLCRQDGEICPFSEPILEIITTDPEMKNWIAPAPAGAQEAAGAAARAEKENLASTIENIAVASSDAMAGNLLILGVGGYLPKRVVRNQELLEGFEKMTDDYIYQVTGIRERRWAAEGEKPSDMAYVAALEAIRKAAIAIKDIDAIIVATTTPDVAMPSTACILQDRLALSNVPAFDINAACSGFLYAIAMAQGMIRAGLASHVLTVGVDLQSRMLDRTDRDTYFIFGDGAGA
ncbi:MAG: hypothetical protein NTX50_12590, partial [Candidatus Sumerlaeota bacterium]|nr:hypothetical protein [Candidatus Sumerlaeota bacterium]